MQAIYKKKFDADFFIYGPCTLYTTGFLGAPLRSSVSRMITPSPPLLLWADHPHFFYLFPQCLCVYGGLTTCFYQEKAMLTRTTTTLTGKSFQT